MRGLQKSGTVTRCRINDYRAGCAVVCNAEIERGGNVTKLEIVVAADVIRRQADLSSVEANGGGRNGRRSRGAA